MARFNVKLDAKDTLRSLRRWLCHFDYRMTSWSLIGGLITVDALDVPPHHRWRWTFLNMRLKIY